MAQKRKISIRRARELKDQGEKMLRDNSLILSGIEMAKRIERRMEEIRSILGATKREWRDWNWHIENRINKLSLLSEIIELSEDEKRDLNRVGKQFRWGISPYYAGLIDPKDPDCPIRLQSVPCVNEILDKEVTLDPMSEDETSPAPSVVRRYPDRLIFNVTNQCSMFCRHCQRKRKIGQRDLHTSDKLIQQAIDYVRENREIRDVLITGGDALMLDDERLDWILGQLDDIPSIEIKRIGSRSPVTLPYRITKSLCNMLSKHHPLFVNMQFNHPKEVTVESASACDLLSKAGIPLGNQAVLLAGINNNVIVQRKLNQTLLKIRVRPYYLFHCKQVKGISHFRTSVDAGIEILENLRGPTSGLAIPHFIVNAPGGLGKVVLSPDYIVSRGKDYVIIRTWEMKTVKYDNHPSARLVKLPKRPPKH